MIEDLRLRNYSPKTIRTYVICVAKFAQYFGRSPDKLGPSEVHAYQLYLRDKKKVSWSHFNQVVCALRFFYTTTLKRDWVVEHVAFAKVPKRLPEVLSPEEVRRLLEAVGNLKHRTILSTVYAGGLRVSEVAKLKITDIDSQRMMIRIEQGKGQKDRYVPLSPRLLWLLREYWIAYRPVGYLFPGAQPERPLHETSIQKACVQARYKAGLKKKISVHTLRHCYATHLLENQVDLRTIQELLGHRSLRTTSGYTRVTLKKLQATCSPFDLLRA
jgi:site-specific recombinase XerD